MGGEPTPLSTLSHDLAPLSMLWHDLGDEDRALLVNAARFLILRWARRPHLASRVLAAGLRPLSEAWRQIYGHPLVPAEIFMEMSRFRGTCYRAAISICVGKTKGYSKSGEAYCFHGRPNSVRLYPLARDFQRQLCRVPRVGAQRRVSWSWTSTVFRCTERVGCSRSSKDSQTPASAAASATASRASWPYLGNGWATLVDLAARSPRCIA